jgi:hypothetical protein
VKRQIGYLHLSIIVHFRERGLRKSEGFDRRSREKVLPKRRLLV